MYQEKIGLQDVNFCLPWKNILLLALLTRNTYVVLHEIEVPGQHSFARDNSTLLVLYCIKNIFYVVLLHNNMAADNQLPCYLFFDVYYFTINLLGPIYARLWVCIPWTLHHLVASEINIDVLGCRNSDIYHHPSCVTFEFSKMIMSWFVVLTEDGI